ncbi:MAG: HD domain-containing protein, partial [Candidatus Hydrogenedentales bacterium]
MKSRETIVCAFEFAYAVHRDQFRKGSRIPYITHAMAVAALVGEFGGSEAQIAAALLHDTVEDGDGLKTPADLRETFGDEVAELVLACSDAFVKPKPPWRERKEQFIETMRT